MKTILAILLLNSISFTIAIANTKADSLENLLKTSPKNTTYVRIAEEYIWYLMNPLDNEKKADSLIKSAQKIAFQIKDFEGYARLRWRYGLLTFRQTKINESIKIFKEVEKLVQIHHLSKTLLQKVYTGYGMSYFYINQFDEALKYALMATELTEKYHLNDHITEAYLIIAEIYYVNHDEKAFSYTQKILNAAYKDTELTMLFRAELAASQQLMQQKKYDEALVHLKKSEYFANTYCRKAVVINCYVAYGSYYFRTNRLKETYIYLIKAKNLAEKLNIATKKADAYAGLGQYFIQQKNYKEAEKYYLKSLEIDKQDNYGYGQKEDFEMLAQANIASKNYKKAFEYQSKAYAIDDSLFSKKLTIKINQLEQEKQKSNIKLLELANQNSIYQRNTILFGGIFIVLILVSIAIVVYNRTKYKQLEAQQNLRNRIAADLHDEIGSTLSSISILSEIVAFQQKKGEFKPEIMLQVSNDSRAVIDKMDDIIWAINPENDAFYNLETRLKSFAIPLLESKDIDFKFEFSPELENLKIDIGKRRDIYLILKEVINNLVKYSQSKTALIEGEIMNNSLIMRILDTGIGFDTLAESFRNGQKNMKNRAIKIGAELDIESRENIGTEVILKIKV